MINALFINILKFHGVQAHQQQSVFAAASGNQRSNSVCRRVGKEEEEEEEAWSLLMHQSGLRCDDV